MSGDWIPMSTDLWTCPEVVRILSGVCPPSVRTLSESVREKSTIVGALYRTWSLFDAHTTDGILHGYTAETLNAEVGIEGWAENLQHVGWLIIETQSLRMPGFDVWLSSSAKARLKERQRKRNERAGASGSCPKSVRKSADKKRTTEEDRRDTNERTNDFAALESAEAEIRSTWPELFEEPYTLEVEPDRSRRMTSPLNAVTDATIMSARATAEWFAAQCYARRPALPRNVRWLAIAIAWSEIAKRGKRPAAVFVSLVRKLKVSEATDHIQAAAATVNAMYRAGQITLAKINGVATHA